MRKIASDSPTHLTQIQLPNIDRDTSILINQMELILSEKRTALAALRTAITVLTVPLSILSFLIATSRYYSFSKVLQMAIPLFLFLVALVLLGIYLLYKSILGLRRYDRLFSELSEKLNRTPLGKELPH